MENKCENCGGELINGQMAGMHGMFFYPEGEIKKLKPKRSSVICYCCKSCGLVQKFTVKEVEKLLQKNMRSFEFGGELIWIKDYRELMIL